MKKTKFTEHGQALILVAFAIVGLVGFAALAIDGGNVFSDRRHSQNASDTSVLAAALERVRRPTEDWQSIARLRAADNGYSSADGVTEVDVHLCSELPLTTADGYTMICKGLDPTADPTQFIYVHIKSIVKLFFAPVVGWRTITNHTDAVAEATLPIPTNMADGYGIWTQHEGCNSPGEGDPFELGGSGDSEVIGAGVLVGASCPTDESFVQNGNPALHTTTGVCVHGTANYDPSEVTSDINPSLRENCPAVDPDTYQMPPAPVCSTEGKLTMVNGKYIAQPGYYDKTGNRQFPDVSGQETVVMQKGIYCLYNGINVNAGITLTTDARNDGFDPGTEGVLIYLPADRSPNIQFNGGATIDLHAITSWNGATFDDSWFNLLIYVSPDYEADIDISGSAGSTYTGTILAPSAHVDLLGNNGTSAGTVTLDSQIISDTVKISGDTDFTLIYNEDNNIVTLKNPDIHLVE
jgi:type II secretory pathway pseudopilin PulG